MGDATSIVSERLVYERLSRFRLVQIHLGTRKLKIRQRSLLSAIWGGGLDTECSICGDIFDKERGPPIRTMSLEGMTSFPKDLTKPSAIYRPIRIHNRHMQCIKNSDIDFIPVSHVWHDAVALAHTSKQATVEATALVYQIPLRTLLGVAMKYGQTVEIWHDYISIPQWQYEIQQQLLLLLPAIFAANQNSLIHLDDRSTADLMGLNDHTSEPSQLFAKQVYFSNARWFQRMWVVLERASSKSRVAMSRDFVLLDSSFDELWNINEDLTFRAFAALGPQLYGEKMRAIAFKRQVSVENIHEYTYSFGSALKVISTRKCREYRDRFTAICGFFPDWSYEDIVQNLPDDAAQACLWVARKCLMNGDYTPLLLTKNNEKEIFGASWLTCHELMDNLSWPWGKALAPAASEPVIDTGKIKIKVQPVGIIEQYLVLKLPENDISTFEYYSREIVKVTGTCANCFISSIGRVYRVATFVQHPPKSTDGRANLNLDFISTKLDLYVAQTGEETDRSHEITKEIFDMLQLSAELASGLSWSVYARLNNNVRGDCLVYVRCKGCRTLSIFRSNMWKEPPSRTQLYRIPGLHFVGSFADGVGMAICENQIIGIMMWGTPACECRELETVVIE